MAYFLALDQGTTSSRAVIFNERGEVVAIGQHATQQFFPGKAWVEQDPEDILSTMLQSIRDALFLAGLSAAQIAAVGITNQRETTVLWDKESGKPAYPAIVWQDRRTASYCDALKAQGLENMIALKTGLLLDPYFSASKIAWILREVPYARQKAEQGHLLFGTIETWLLWQLTKGKSHVTDITNASRTLLFNIHQLRWDNDLLKLFDISPQILPTVVDNIGDFGEISADFFGTPMPVCAMMGDQQAALFGQACFYPGMAKATLGTGCFMLLHTGTQPVLSQHQLITTIQYKFTNELAYGLEGSIFIAGAAVSWLRDNLKLIRTSGDIQTLASQVDNNGGVYFVPALTGLGAPYWDANARGIIAGLTRDTHLGHLARAALEAVCYQMRDLLQAIEEDGANIARMRVDGGMTVNDILLQFLADMLQVPVEQPRVLETTALGIAFLTGLAIGVYSSFSDIEKLWQLKRQFMPMMSSKECNNFYAEWQYWVGKVLKQFDVAAHT